MKLFKEHQYLLMRRECRVVLGRRASNLWLLTIVLTATFFAVAFSAASTNYLSEKMDDPFTNWVNIELAGASDVVKDNLQQLLNNDSVQLRFGFNGMQSEINSSLNLVTIDGKSKPFSALFYENLSNSLIKKVLKEDNVVNACSIDTGLIADETLGVIMTMEALESLGYSKDNPPVYVGYYSKSVGADTLGVEMLDRVYARAPLPLLAVVKRLPMNKEVIASKYLDAIRRKPGRNCPIDMCHENYVKELFFFVPTDVVEDFSTQNIRKMLSPDLGGCIDEVMIIEKPNKGRHEIDKRLRPWKKGMIIQVYTHAGTSIKTVNYLEDTLKKYYMNKGVERIYNYDAMAVDGSRTRDNVYSVYFERLDSIASFERFVKATSTLQIEMTQVNAKKNFNAVSKMAIVLTVAMLVFSIISIIIFIVNMMQSYFPKVKRNLGTFKAFGLSTGELVKVYVVIIVGIVIMALIMALTIVGFTELFLPLRDNESKYLILWNMWTCSVVALILLSTLVSVIIVLRNLLRNTPGNLIYDR